MVNELLALQVGGAEVGCVHRGIRGQRKFGGVSAQVVRFIETEVYLFE